MQVTLKVFKKVKHCPNLFQKFYSFEQYCRTAWIIHSNQYWKLHEDLMNMNDEKKARFNIIDYFYFFLFFGNRHAISKWSLSCWGMNFSIDMKSFFFSIERFGFYLHCLMTGRCALSPETWLREESPVKTPRIEIIVPSSLKQSLYLTCNGFPFSSRRYLILMNGKNVYLSPVLAFPKSKNFSFISFKTEELFGRTFFSTRTRLTELYISDIFNIFSMWLLILSSSWIAQCPGVHNYCSLCLILGCSSINFLRARIIIEFRFWATQESDHRTNFSISGFSFKTQFKITTTALAISFPPRPATHSGHTAK